jgi:hypothetical protein
MGIQFGDKVRTLYWLIAMQGGRENVVDFVCLKASYWPNSED